MRTSRNIALLTLLVLFIATSFNCGKKSSDCSNFTSDTALLKVTLAKSPATIKTTDTVWFQSTISDTLYNRQASDKVIYDLSQLFLQIQPYRITQADSVPTLTYTSTDFSILMNDGTRMPNSSPGINFIYRRDQPYNYLKVGFVPSKVGLYLFTFRHSIYQGYYRIDITSTSNYCKQFNGMSYLSSDQQNKQYWDNMNVSTLNLQNTEYPFVQKQDPNYFFIKVVK